MGSRLLVELWSKGVFMLLLVEVVESSLILGSKVPQRSRVLFSLGLFPSSSILLSDLDDGLDVNEEEIEDIEVTAKGFFRIKTSVWVSTDFCLTVLVDFLTIFLRLFSALNFYIMTVV